jgi:hypothetical protein
MPSVLPDAAQYLAVYDEIDRVLRTEGWQAAFRLFEAQVGHVPPDQLPLTMAVLLEPATVLEPGPHRDLMERLSGNWEYMMRFEMQPCIRYVADLDQIGAEFAEFPGGHQAPADVPGPFAAALHGLFERL